jgi:serine-type D-Ala-D-Ala carboxypeptidase/endopeptidase (penicillin-binding protein 4)
MKSSSPVNFRGKARFTLAIASCMLVLLLSLNLVGLPYPAWAQEDMHRLIINGGYMVADDGKTQRHRENEPFIPASTLKILTGLVALERLGLAYRFETHFFLDRQNNLYIKGFGDPLLTSETLLEIGIKLRTMGIERLHSLCLDDSVFDLRDETASEENSAKSYDAPNSALAVNFNAVALQVSERGEVTPGEPETPPLPLMRELGRGLPLGSHHRLNINTLPPLPEKPATLRYAAELFSAQLQRAGIVIQQTWTVRKAPDGLQPILIHQSRAALDEIVSECLKYSNNFIANQLFLACGAHAYGLPATWEKARKTFTDYAATTLGLAPDNLTIVEGAGLSRQNRLSAAGLIQILNRFKPYATLLHPRDAVPLKSGTLTGVYCYAGYFPKDENLIPFAILLNQTPNTRNELLQELQRRVAGNASP